MRADERIGPLSPSLPHSFLSSLSAFLKLAFRHAAAIRNSQYKPGFHITKTAFRIVKTGRCEAPSSFFILRKFIAHREK
jgi:hypothetical protein